MLLVQSMAQLCDRLDCSDGRPERNTENSRGRNTEKAGRETVQSLVEIL